MDVAAGQSSTYQHGRHEQTTRCGEMPVARAAHKRCNMRTAAFGPALGAPAVQEVSASNTSRPGMENVDRRHGHHQHQSGHGVQVAAVSPLRIERNGQGWESCCFRHLLSRPMPSPRPPFPAPHNSISSQPTPLRPRPAAPVMARLWRVASFQKPPPLQFP
jgi:hypothetical protein